MHATRRSFTILAAASSLLAAAGTALATPKAPKAHHHNGKSLVGEKVKKNGKHEIGKKGANVVTIGVKEGKIAGMQVKHAKKGDLPVKKYKTAKTMARRDGIRYASYQRTQAQSLGTAYIGYAYLDEDGYEEIYWFPYEMIYDGDTGAVEYVPVYGA
ncbi:MAG TPA: hypothetical protein VIV84_03830 [Burkholderiaceae bacterium]